MIWGVLNRMIHSAQHSASMKRPDIFFIYLLLGYGKYMINCKHNKQALQKRCKKMQRFCNACFLAVVWGGSTFGGRIKQKTE